LFRPGTICVEENHVSLRPVCFIVLLLLAAVGSAHAAGLTLEAVNAAEFSAGRSKGLNPATVKAQVLLDRARFSPGVIDGAGGENFRKALAAFQQRHGLRPTGRLDAATWEKLNAAVSAPALIEYVLKEGDVKGPFADKIPKKMEEMAGLKNLGHTSALELLSEKFHADEKLLKALNPGKQFRTTGETVVVPNVEQRGERLRVSKIEIDKKLKVLRALNKEGELVAFYPASIGSAQKPAPSGSYEVRAVAENPTYTYNPDYKFKGVKSKKPFDIPGGPNNPVGAVWIEISLKSYGIHGTPDPAKVSKTYSHGCVRLTNWDVKDLAQLVSKGTQVEFMN
jgi:lipoprotein-anchoring transpeptidase ErfK/SrfK